MRLSEVADVRIAPTPNHIQREQRSRRIDVGANVEGRDLASVVDDVEDKVDDIKFPREYHAEVLGESTELNAAQDRLYTFGIAAAIAIFLLLRAAFGSLRLAALTFVLLPMALVGGVLAVWLGDGVLSLGSLVGFLTVFGIAARNGILMISHFQHLERHEGETFGPALVLREAKPAGADPDDGVGHRLALVPLAVAGSLPGHEIEHPMAIVILGGLTTSTLNLFVLPSLYLRFGKSKRDRLAGGEPAATEVGLPGRSRPSRLVVRGGRGHEVFRVLARTRPGHLVSHAVRPTRSARAAASRRRDAPALRSARRSARPRWHRPTSYIEASTVPQTSSSVRPKSFAPSNTARSGVGEW